MGFTSLFLQYISWNMHSFFVFCFVVVAWNYIFFHDFTEGCSMDNLAIARPSVLKIILCNMGKFFQCLTTATQERKNHVCIYRDVLYMNMNMYIVLNILYIKLQGWPFGQGMSLWPTLHGRISFRKSLQITWGSRPNFIQTGSVWSMDQIGKYLRPLLLTWITLILSLISNHIPSKVWNEITYPFPNFKGATAEVWIMVSNFTPHFMSKVITYPCWYSNQNMLVKEATALYGAAPTVSRCSDPWEF